VFFEGVGDLFMGSYEAVGTPLGWSTFRPYRPAATWEVERLTTIGQLVARGVGVVLLATLALRFRAGSVATVPLRPAPTGSCSPRPDSAPRHTQWSRPACGRAILRLDRRRAVVPS
jgi:hypothetical protein